MIFNIQKCSIHDGEGLRTTVFFKGCPLRCLWCSNPESQSYKKEIMEFPNKCIGCGACEKVCPESAISVIDGEYRIDRNLCTKCFKCTDVCYAEAKEVVGEDMDVETLFKEINKDRLFYQRSGGGVTFSGGEPLTHPDFLAEIAKKCKINGINTSMETCGFGNYEKFKKALPYIDSMFIDVKHMDSDVHKKITGVGNEVILDNIRAISTHGIPIIIRTPVIPGYNDSIDNIEAIALFIKDLQNVQGYELLPYHELGSSKYTSLGVPYELGDVASPAEEKIIELVKQLNCILQPYGKQCYYTKNNKKEIIKC